MVFVDSDLIIGTLRKKSTEANVKAKDVLKMLFKNGHVKTTIFNYAELIEGTYYSSNVAKSQRILLEYLKKFEVVPFLTENALEFSRISAELGKKGMPIGDLDMLIASIIIFHDEVLYTRNIEHFKKISDLKIVNWSEVDII